MSPPSRRATDKRFSGTLADRVRHARHLVGISQAALANQVGVVPSAVAQWEGSQRTSPTVEHLTRVAQATNVAFEWLATGRGPTTVTEATTPAVYMQSPPFADIGHCPPIGCGAKYQRFDRRLPGAPKPESRHPGERRDPAQALPPPPCLPRQQHHRFAMACSRAPLRSSNRTWPAT